VGPPPEGRRSKLKRVLIIDDEDDIRAIAEMSLERVGGWGVLSADSGEAGIELAIRERPDAILLDSMMPGIDGAQTLARLKDDQRTAEIPVVFLTASTRSADRGRYAELGAVGVLAKPFDPMELPDAVAGVLGWE
jgi:CheY-like chemotaxis protein